ncbi:MAG: hypothetical protein IJD92_03030 [Bacilli bacterium]|nr:hypothetical protein [Bacilli bacterium]
MNNVVDMVKYYIVHKNADNSVIEYLKNKIDKCEIKDLIVVQVELLFTDPCDNVVSELVNYINNKINIILKDIKLSSLVNLICDLHNKVDDLLDLNKELENNNDTMFSNIKLKNFNNDISDTDNASILINEIQNNKFIISRNNSVISSINIWLNNLSNSFNKRVDNVNIKELLVSYIDLLSLINKDEFINNYINKISNNIDKLLLNSNLLETITNIIPEIDKIYKDNYEEKNNIYKLLDYYIDLVEITVKKKINNLNYEEKILLKEKIELIIEEILNNDNPDDDFKVLVINSYLKLL